DWPMKSPLAVRALSAPIAAPSVWVGRMIHDDQANGVVAQSDGKLVAAGVAKTSRSQDFALARYNPNGSLDATFGTGGKVTTDFAGDDDAAFAAVLPPAGKIVAAGGARASERPRSSA